MNRSCLTRKSVLPAAPRSSPFSSHRFLRFVTLAVAGTVLASVATPAGTFLPAPQQVDRRGPPVLMAPGVSITGSNPSTTMTFLIGFVTSKLTAAGFSVGVSSPGLTVLFHVHGDPEPVGGLPADVRPFTAMGEEGYALLAEDQGTGHFRIVIAAGTPHGVFNGAMTLLQLLITDAGGRESYLAAQRILDFPDYPLRGGMLSSVNTYPSLWESVKAHVDDLARMKVTFVSPTLHASPLTSSWASLKGPLMQLQDYSRARFMEIVPSVGSLRNDPFVDYHDGWWTRRELFHFETVQGPGLLGNPSFEADRDGDAAPDGWYVPCNAGGRWTPDFGQAHDGALSMRLEAFDDPRNSLDLDSTDNLALRQRFARPGAGKFGVSAWVRTQNLTATELKIELTGVDAFGSKVGTPLSAGSGLGTLDWREVRLGPVEFDSTVPQVQVSAFIPEPGFGTAWVDQVRFLPMVQDAGGAWRFDEAVNAEVAVPGPAIPSGPPPGLLNGGLEVDADQNGVPDGWTIVDNADPQAEWTRDAASAHCGGFSMRLEAFDTPPASEQDRSNDVLLTQSTGVVPPGIYQMTAWARSAGVQGVEPQFTIYPQTNNQAAFSQSAFVYAGSPQSWSKYSAVIRVDQPDTRVVFYSRIREPGYGKIWLDDVKVQRVDGMLRNVLRADYDVRVESADLGTVYREGVDYEVVNGAQSAGFDEFMGPTLIRRLPNSSIPSGGEVRVSYDQGLVWSSNGGATNPYNLCTSRVFDDLWKPGLDRLIGEAGATSITVYSDEIRGLNRSGACYNDDGTLKRTNAAVVAGFLNQVTAYARTLNPDIAIYAWDDMFSSFHNGGVDYQLPYGGPAGKTDEAVTQGLLDPSLRMWVWWYGPDDIRQMVASSNFWAGYRFSRLVAPWFDATNIDDWAAISASSPWTLGVLATAWSGDEPGLPQSVDLFWNLQWGQILFADFEATSLSELTSQGYTFTGDTRWTQDSTCAAPNIFPPTGPNANTDGVCIGPGGGSVGLYSRPVDPSRLYRVSIPARSNAPVPATLRSEWALVSGSTMTVDTPLNLGGLPGYFWRSRVDLPPPANKSPVSALKVTLLRPSGTGDLAVDNLMVWESRPGCPHDADSDGARDCDLDTHYEEPVSGTVSLGTMSDIRAASRDDTYEAISETGGGNAKGLIRVWTFSNLPAGVVYDLKVEGYRSSSTADTFRFYSATRTSSQCPSGQICACGASENWSTSPVLTVDKTSDDDAVQSAYVGGGEILCVKVQDSTPSSDSQVDRLYLDRLFLSPRPACTDADGDRYTSACGACSNPFCPVADCDDANFQLNPGQTEGPWWSSACTDGFDNDCDLLVDSADPGCAPPTSEDKVNPNGDVQTHWQRTAGFRANYPAVDEGFAAPSGPNDGVDYVYLPDSKTAQLNIVDEYQLTSPVNMLPGWVTTTFGVDVRVRASNAIQKDTLTLGVELVVSSLGQLETPLTVPNDNQWHTLSFTNLNWNNRRWARSQVDGMSVRIRGSVTPGGNRPHSVGLQVSTVQVTVRATTP